MAKLSPEDRYLLIMAEVERETLRFLVKIRSAIEDMQRDGSLYRSHENAAAKRASMDLTKALAKYRKGPFGK